jgi:hypothetical protein
VRQLEPYQQIVAGSEMLTMNPDRLFTQGDER